MRFITFVKRCDTPTMLRCMMEAFEYFGGLPKAALTDRMKSVFLDMDGKTPIWNPLFADFMASLGVSPRVCRPFKPQTKGKVERSVGVIKNGFWPGVHFTDIDHLNGQAKLWCDRLNQKVHRTTRKVPMDMWVEENLTPLPNEFAWERFGAEDGISQLGWLHLVRWGLLRLTSGPTGSWCGSTGARTAASTAHLSSRSTDYDAYEASSLPRHCTASRPIQGGRTSCTAGPHGSPTGTSSRRPRRLSAQPGGV
jgi:hypothetical protein